MRLICGDALTVLKTLPSDSIDCCVTSPPYWGLRDYGTAIWTGGLQDCNHVQRHGSQGTTGQRADRTYIGQVPYRDLCGKCGAIRIDAQLGLERTPEEYVAKMVEIFRQVRRVIRGTLWLNIGDCYATGAGKVGDHPGGGDQGSKWAGFRGDHPHDAKLNGAAIPMGPMTQPNRMPLLGLKPKDLVGIPWMLAFALRADGWWLRSEVIWAKPNPMPESVTDRPTKAHEQVFLFAKSERYYYDDDAIREPHAKDSIPRALRHRFGGKFNGQSHKEQSPLAKGAGYGTGDPSRVCSPEGRNKRSVWTVPTQPTPEAHFATYPIALIEPCILAGCPEGGTVLDPFAGAGTTGMAALKHGRDFVGIELNPAYIEIARKRLSDKMPLLAQEVTA